MNEINQEITLTALPRLTLITEEPSEVPEASDRLLLAAWVERRDCDAFAYLVERYSSLVMGVCRCQCRTSQDAEDAFQATFMTLSRDAKKLRKQDCLAGWLHQVAYRTACRARKQFQEMDALVIDPMDHRESLSAIAHRHRLSALDEELSLLPNKYRNAIVLHYLKGYTYQQVAEILRSTEPAIRGRLQRARARLQRQLGRRGFSFTAVIGSIAALTTDPVVAGDPVAADLIHQTINRCSDRSGELPASQNLDSLLLKDTPMLLSTASLGTLGAAAVIAAGFLVAPFGEEPAVNADPQPVKLLGVNSSAPKEHVGTEAFQSKVSDAPVVLTHSEPSPSEPVKKTTRANTGDADPFGGGQFGGDPFGNNSDPFAGADKQKASSRPKSIKQTDGQPGAAQGAAKSTWASGNAEFYEQVERELSQPVELQFSDIPLSQAIDEIAKKSNLTITIEEYALDDVNLSEDPLVRLSASHISLDSALNLLLTPLELTYTVDNEVVAITSREHDEDRHQLLRIYWAGEVGLQASNSSIELIQTLVDPNSWERMGGTGTISVLNADTPANSGLGIRTTYQPALFTGNIVD